MLTKIQIKLIQHLSETQTSLTAEDIAKLMDISSSFIRNAVRQGKNVEYMLPQRVWQYLREMHFYEK